MTYLHFCKPLLRRRILIALLAGTLWCSLGVAEDGWDGWHWHDRVTITGSPATSVTAGKAYSFTPTASDSEGRTLVFSITNKPSWASFNTGSGRLSGTPSSGNVGTYSNIVIAASDGRRSAALPAFAVQVLAGQASTSPPPPPPPPPPPTISGTPPTSDAAGSPYSFQPSASGPSGLTLSFSVQNKPAWASFSIASGQLSGTPTSAQTGTYPNIILSVSDGVASSALPAFTITVTPASSTTGSGASVAATPTFSVPGGVYASAQSVKLACTTASSTIYYTTNGTAPTTSSSVYSSAISVPSTETLEAICAASGYTNSAVASATYTISGSSSSPQIVQHWDTSTSPAGSGNPTGNNYQVNIAPTGSGDVVIFGFTGLSGQTPTVTDSASDAIPSAICSADNGPTNGVSYLYAIAPTAGTTWFKVAWSGSGVTEFNFVLTEFNNISSVAAQGHNCEAGLTATSGTVTPAVSFTPTSNSAGNLIYNYTALATGNNLPACNASGYTPASGFERFGGDTTNWLNGNGYGFQSVMETEIQETAAPVVASMKMAGETCSGGNGDPFNSLTVALKIGSAGISYPSGIHVAQVQQLTTDSFGGANLPSSFSIPFSAIGNLRVFVFEAVNGNGSWDTANGTVTSSDGCNFTQVTGANSGELLYYAQGCSPCPNCTITFPLHSGASLANTAGKFYDIVNAASSSYLGYSDSNLNCSTGSIANNPSLTPSTAPGLVLVAVGIGNGPASGLTAPSGAVYAVPYFTGISDGEHLAFGDAHGFYNYSTTAAQSWTWTVSGPGNTCTGLAAEFH